MAPKKKGKGKKGQRKKVASPSGGGGSPAVTPAPDRGELTGLRSRPDLNGRRVEVRGQAAGKDGAPRLEVRLLFGAGAGTVLKVKPANLELDKDRGMDDPAMATLVAEMQALAPGATPPEERRDWAGGLPDLVLAKIAEMHVARTEAGQAAFHKKVCMPDEQIQDIMAKRKRDGNCLFVIAMVCKGWRKAQLKVGGRLRTRVGSDVMFLGRVALAKWALAEGCPREHENGFTMAMVAAAHGHMELVRWLVQEQGFTMTKKVMSQAACSGNLELLQWLRANGCPWDVETCSLAALFGHVAALRWARKNGCNWDARTCFHAAKGGHLEILQWLRANGCPWDGGTCYFAVKQGHVEVLRWARENGCPWIAQTRDQAAAELGYTDGFGNLMG